MKNEELKVHIKDRAFDFAVRILKMSAAMPKNPASYALTNQIVRSGTSIGANIEEAQGAFSKRDFIYKMQISLKEARETLYWIKLIVASGLLSTSKTDSILKENDEIVRILTVIVKSAKVNMKIVNSE